MNRIYINEVATRDGFQIEKVFVPTEQKIKLVDDLGRTGVAKIEVSSFSSPRAIPSLADAETVFAHIDRRPGIEYSALVPNVRGAERALGAGVDELNVVVSVSATHNMANLRMTPEQSLAQLREIVALSHGRGLVNASVSTAFGCPFEGEIPIAKICRLVDSIVACGVPRITLCDTTGMAHPRTVESLCGEFKRRWPEVSLAAHFHDTRGLGLVNALTAYQCGVDRFDAALGGLGGCPFAPGASGNVCTEDLVHMFWAMGVHTGVDLDALLPLAQRISNLVGHEVPGQVMKAGPWTRQYALSLDAIAGCEQVRLVASGEAFSSVGAA